VTLWQAAVLFRGSWKRIDVSIKMRDLVRCSLVIIARGVSCENLEFFYLVHQMAIGLLSYAELQIFPLCEDSKSNTSTAVYWAINSLGNKLSDKCGVGTDPLRQQKHFDHCSSHPGFHDKAKCIDGGRDSIMPELGGGDEDSEPNDLDEVIVLIEHESSDFVYLQLSLGLFMKS
jgi:hypothetical protein